MHNEKLIEELNQLLKGAHMGAFVIENLCEKLRSKELQDVFHQILDNLNIHEKAITALIIAEQGEPVDTAGVMGTLTDMMYSFKNLSIATDEEVLKEAVKSMEMAVKAIKDFDSQHYTLKIDMQKTIRIMEDDYSSIYHMLHKYLIEYKR